MKKVFAILLSIVLCITTSLPVFAYGCSLVDWERAVINGMDSSLSVLPDQLKRSCSGNSDSIESVIVCN